MKKIRKLYLALIHSPVYNKYGELVCTSITNHDIHDISRLSRTFGVARYYIVNPVEELRTLATTIISHWQEGSGATYNPNRKEAFETTVTIDTIDSVLADITAIEGVKPKIILTSAKVENATITYEGLFEKLDSYDEPVLLLFGTGHGLGPIYYEMKDHVLPPIFGYDEYNHLPVRSAVAIILDRLTNSKNYN